MAGTAEVFFSASFFFFFFFYLFFNRSIITLQHCVGFCCRNAWISCMSPYIPSLQDCPPPPRQVVTEHSERSFREASCWFSAARRAGSHRGVPGSSVGKNPLQCRRAGSIPGLGRAPGKGNGNPLQYSCLEEPGRLPSMGSQELDTTVADTPP